MPELPEVECVKQTLEPLLVGGLIEAVELHRTDVLRIAGGGRTPPHGKLKQALLLGSRITRLERRGKQLAIINDEDAVVCIHLGMSGQCWIDGRAERRHSSVTSGSSNGRETSHIHCRWRIRSGRESVELIFRDPRRFGGIWTFPSYDRLVAERWVNLGPDALTIRTPALRGAFERTRRVVKSALLDQRTVAGIGNIYADEALFAAGIHPMKPTCSLNRSEIATLSEAIRVTLRRAIAGGGSTLRDYRNGNGQSGEYQSQHAVYGRSGLPCIKCGTTLTGALIGQRSSVFCPHCQPRCRTKSARPCLM